MRHDFAAGLDAQDIGGHVQRAEFGILFADLEHLVVEEHGPVEVAAAVQHAMADGVDLRHRMNSAVFGMHERVQHRLHGDLVIGHILLDHLFALRPLVVQHAAADTDALHAALYDHRFGVHIEQLVFEGRTACVYDQNFHLSDSCLLFLKTVTSASAMP